MTGTDCLPAFPSGYCTGLGGAAVKSGGDTSALCAPVAQQQESQQEGGEEGGEKGKGGVAPDQHALWRAAGFSA